MHTIKPEPTSPSCQYQPQPAPSYSQPQAAPSYSHPQPPPSTQPQPSSTSSSSKVEFIESVRGSLKLLHDGYTYVCHSERSNGNVAWRCDRYNKAHRDKGTQCNATALTTGMSSFATLEYARPHNHFPSTGRVGAYRVKNQIKIVASQNLTATPHHIVGDSLCNVSETVSNHLPDMPALKKIVQRKRKKDALAMTSLAGK